MKNSKFTAYVMIFMLSTCVFYLGFIARLYYGFILSFLVLSISYFILTIILLKKYKNKLPTVGIIVAIIAVFIDIPLRIIDFHETLVSLPDLIGRLIAIASAYIYVKQARTLGKVITSVLTLSFIVSFSLVGYEYYYHCLKFGTLTGKTEQTINKPIVFQSDKREDISLSDLKGKYIVLDFWSSSCGACIKQFPIVQTVYDQCKAGSDIDFYSVFCLGKENETIQAGVDILAKRGYTFPVLSLKKNDPILKEIEVTGFPTVIIFDPNGKLIFRGEITFAMKVLDEIVTSDK